MKYDRFDLEQLILKNWEVVTEIKHLRELMESKPTQDQIENYLLGLETIYEVKFNKLWDCFEELCQHQKIIS
ncbi:MAG: hypothetical protein EBW12_07710 [Actinobacteria bacterium]|jgi:hypothetical protein|nr:hypothetical protein [Actinomycetota bacterium]